MNRTFFGRDFWQNRKRPEPVEDRLLDHFSLRQRVQKLAYLKWEKATGGNPVDEEQTKRFWLEAEREVQEELAL